MRRAALSLVLLAACGAPPGRTELTVAAAMSLKEAFLELEQSFEREHPDVDVVFNFAGSQVLAAQIVEGAPVDVFASADHAQIEGAATSGRLLPARIFARNRLVIIAPAGSTTVVAPADLGKRGVRLVLAAEGVPAGAYARAALAKLGLRDAALANVVSNEENVRGVIGKVAAGEADAGVVYATDVTDAVAGKLRVLAFAGAEDVVPTYEIAALGDSKQPAAAAAFVDAVAGPPGAAALQRRGFLPP
jgi:molybdate transport system substrate-binding protein